MGAVGVDPNGPAFRQVYHRLFGPTFPGEYFPPADAEKTQGTYVLSYPGVAFSFRLQHAAWTGNSDFVSVLSSPAASAARCMTVFNGSSWKDARSDLLTRPCPHPRSLAATGHAREASPDEIDMAVIKGRGRVELQRRLLPSFELVLGETTPQDLVAQLGPPDAVYRKHDRRLSIHRDRRSSRNEHPPVLAASPGAVGGVSDTDRSSISTTTDYSSSEEDAVARAAARPAAECFYNYFRHGFDVFVAYASAPSPELDPARAPAERRPDPVPAGRLVATKILLYGNVPGSYAFNRYRRGRWALDANEMRPLERPLNSETPFATVRRALKRVWRDARAHGMADSASQRHMVLNRGWDDSPGSSMEMLDWEGGSESLSKGPGNSAILGNTELHGFPGLLFEVLKNDAVSCLTVY